MYRLQVPLSPLPSSPCMSPDSHAYVCDVACHACYRMEHHESPESRRKLEIVSTTCAADCLRTAFFLTAFDNDATARTLCAPIYLLLCVCTFTISHQDQTRNRCLHACMLTVTELWNDIVEHGSRQYEGKPRN
jgi:hypothetical protein